MKLLERPEFRFTRFTEFKCSNQDSIVCHTLYDGVFGASRTRLGVATGCFNTGDSIDKARPLSFQKARTDRRRLAEQISRGAASQWEFAAAASEVTSRSACSSCDGILYKLFESKVRVSNKLAHQVLAANINTACIVMLQLLLFGGALACQQSAPTKLLLPMDDDLQHPLQQHALQHLPAASLAHLRATCRTLQRIVDVGTGDVWRHAAAGVCPIKTLPKAQDGFEVQARLVKQAVMSVKLLSGDHVHLEFLAA